jgi:hypothetical protein
MKKHFLPLVLLSFIVSSIANTALCQSKQPTRSLAMQGDSVWIIINPVKADKRAEFEKFVHDIFWAGAGKLSKQDQKTFRQTRILHPVEPEEDGTYSYFFIMDPLLKGANYDIMSLLTKMYGETKAKEHMKLMDEAMAGEQKSYRVVQSRH